MLGLPSGIQACLFDMDGVLTQTSVLHRRAWKETFDPLLAARGQSPFTDEDYAAYVDGRPREDGVRTFLASRGIQLPAGTADDAPDTDTVYGIGNRKNAEVQRRLASDGVETYPGSRVYLEAVRAAGLQTAVVTASANSLAVLRAAGLEGSFDARIDGVVARERQLAGKPSPDTFLEGARALGVAPVNAAVFEDAIAGVEAGRAGGFGCVIGVDRLDQAVALRDAGADRVVGDLAELIVGRR
jgi:beta-phosphoglucomutase family hydrolase